MELESVFLVNGMFYTVGTNKVSRIFMFNNETSMTHVTIKDRTLREETVIKIPYHSVLYYI